jgi:hypothetical protein
VKRSKSVRLVLVGGFSGVLGCAPSGSITSTDVFTNNYYVPGVGYYHAPFRSWYSMPYNHYDPGTSRYFYGGQWGGSPYESAVNISSPTPEAVRLVSAHRTDVQRSGFGSSSRHYSIRS